MVIPGHARSQHRYRGTSSAFERGMCTGQTEVKKSQALLKIKEEVKKQLDAGFLEVSKYPQWVANIVPVPKKKAKYGCV